jgi:hypothetical protein
MQVLNSQIAQVPKLVKRVTKKKQPYAHPGKGPATLGLTYTSFPCISVRGYFQDLNS